MSSDCQLPLVLYALSEWLSVPVWLASRLELSFCSALKRLQLITVNYQHYIIDHQSNSYGILYGSTRHESNHNFDKLEFSTMCAISK